MSVSLYGLTSVKMVSGVLTASSLALPIRTRPSFLANQVLGRQYTVPSEVDKIKTLKSSKKN